MAMQTTVDPTNEGVYSYSVAGERPQLAQGRACARTESAMQGLHVNPTHHLMDSLGSTLRSAGRRVAAGIRIVDAVRRRDVARAMIYWEVLQRG